MLVITNIPLIVDGRHVEAGTTIEMDAADAARLGEAVKAVKKGKLDGGSKDGGSKGESNPPKDPQVPAGDESTSDTGNQEDPGATTTEINTDL